MAPEVDWTERTVPELYKFEKVGDSVIGFLERAYRELAEGKQVPTYLIRLDTGDRIKIRGTHDLLQKLHVEDTGMRVRIVFDGTQKTGNGDMHIYKVWTKPGPARSRATDVGITDEDIPF